jgi:hypothetical protein
MTKVESTGLKTRHYINESDKQIPHPAKSAGIRDDMRRGL